MSKRGFKLVLSHSIPTVSFLRSNSFSAKPSPVFHSRPCKISRQNIFSIISRFVTTSSPDNLDGLIDPDLDFSGNDSFSADNSRAEPVSADEFAFLRDTLLGSGGGSSYSIQKIESGKHSNVAVLILNAIRDNNDGFGDKTQKFLRNYRDKLNDTLVVDVLNSIQSPELGVKFFIGVYTNRPFILASYTIKPLIY